MHLSAIPPRDVDVVVVGAGLAGLAAARELGGSARSVLVVEGRDRLGGRAYRGDAFGRRLEFGGAWVHWFQPHVWAELTRYGLTAVDSTPPTLAAWSVDGEYRHGSHEQFEAVLDQGMTTLTAGSESAFPYPYDPSHELARIDDETTIADAINGLDLDGEARAAVTALWQLNAHGSLGEVALSQAQRWNALSGNSWRLTDEAAGRCIIEEGTDALVGAMADDASADLVLEEVVTGIHDMDEGVVVTLAGGRQVRARACIVTVPINALASIEFEPALPDPLAELAATGQASKGSKTWFRARGSVEPFVAFTPGDDSATTIWWQYATEDGFIGVAFAADGDLHRPDDSEWVSSAVSRYDSNLEVLEVAGHDWGRDPFSRGTWAMLRPGQLPLVQAAQRPHGNVILAGGDYAAGWAGFFDGAIQDGLRAARQTVSLLASTGGDLRDDAIDLGDSATTSSALRFDSAEDIAPLAVTSRERGH